MNIKTFEKNIYFFNKLTAKYCTRVITDEVEQQVRNLQSSHAWFSTELFVITMLVAAKYLLLFILHQNETILCKNLAFLYSFGRLTIFCLKLLDHL